MAPLRALSRAAARGPRRRCPGARRLAAARAVQPPATLEIQYLYRKKALEPSRPLARRWELCEYRRRADWRARRRRAGCLAGEHKVQKKTIDRRWLPLNALRAFEG